MANGIISQVNIDKLYDIAAKYDASHNEIETTYAKLNNGKIPGSLLPSYVDDVIEGYYLKDSSNKQHFYETNSTSGVKIDPESGRIYVDLNSNKTYRWSGSQYIEISAQIAYGTGTAAPNAHTHSVTVSGTTGNNSGNAVAAVTGYNSFSGGDGSLTSDTTSANGIKYVEAQGTFAAGTTPPASASFSGKPATSGANSGTAVNAVTAVEITTTGSAAPGGHKHNYDKTTGVTLTANNATDTGRIQYVQSISGTKPSLTGTKTFVTGVDEGSGSLTSNTTATNGIQYVEAVALAAGTPPPASASPTHTSTNSGSSGAGTSTTIASVSDDGVLILTASVNTATAHTHTYDKATGVTLTAGTAPSLSTNTTKYLHHTHTSAKSKGTASVGIKDGEYSATTKYLSAAPAHESVASTANDGTNIDAATAITATGTAEVARNGHTHDVTADGSITLNAGTAPSMTPATTKYLHHTHNSASLGEASTQNAAPHTHAHDYSSTVTTGNNSGDKVDVLTPVE